MTTFSCPYCGRAVIAVTTVGSMNATTRGYDATWRLAGYCDCPRPVISNGMVCSDERREHVEFLTNDAHRSDERTTP